jgi:5-formyltetrahydrofolate cyclo-ligase
VASDGAIGDAKRVLRALMRQVRAVIAADGPDRQRRSDEICAGVIDSIGGRCTDLGSLRVLLYDPLVGEPDLTALSAWCGMNDVDTYLPEVDGDSLRVMPGDVDPALLDVVVVPGLAFTPDGRRLGQGGGHFDRFLARLRADCVRIGVAFDEQLVADLPTSSHDIAVDVVITA